MLIFLILSVIVLFPILCLVIGALKPSSEIIRSGLNARIDLDIMGFFNFKSLFTSGTEYFIWFKNSFLLTIVQTLLSLFVSASVAYGFAMYEFKMKKDMKKILFAIPLFAMLLVACDPIVDEISPDPNVTPENLTFELVAKNQGNNNIQIVPTPSRYVKVYDATSDIKLAEGTAPSVQVAPPNKELQVYVTTINSDGSITKSASKSIAVTEYTDLPAIYADVFGTTPDGGYGTTTWVWNTEAADGCWGNGGYLGNTGPGWWICDAVGDVGNGRGQIDEQAVGKGLPDDGLKWLVLT